jgi:hypothetical protein
MSLIGLLTVLVLVVLILWAVRTITPLLGLPPPIQTVIYVVVVVLVVLWLLNVLTGFSFGRPVIH